MALRLQRRHARRGQARCRQFGCDTTLARMGSCVGGVFSTARVAQTIGAPLRAIPVDANARTLSRPPGQLRHFHAETVQIVHQLKQESDQGLIEVRRAGGLVGGVGGVTNPETCGTGNRDQGGELLAKAARRAHSHHHLSAPPGRRRRALFQPI